jgi:Na+-driven multidrug efflux pump
VGWSFILMGVSMVVTSTVRANGVVLMPLLILIFGSVIVRFIVGFAGHPVYGADAIWWSFNANSIASAALALVYYRYGKWRTVRAVPIADPSPILPP